MISILPQQGLGASSDVLMYCPHCGHPVRLPEGIALPTIRLAIELQLRSNGTMIDCQVCAETFVLQQLHGNRRMTLAGQDDDDEEDHHDDDN